MNFRNRILLVAAVLGAWSLNIRADDAGLVPLNLKLPAPIFAGTPPPGMKVDLTPAKPPVIMVPPDVHNLAPKAKITCSDKSASSATLAKLVDGDKEAEEDSIIELKKGLQWVQFDLGKPEELYAIAVWHAFDTLKVYRSVIIQVADDEDFTENVRTLFNNDAENLSGLGAGTDHQYVESNIGKAIPIKGARARYVRLYSSGSTESPLNEYIEVEIYGKSPSTNTAAVK